MRVLEHVLQHKNCIRSVCFHTEGRVKYNLGRQLHTLKCIRSTLESQLKERLDAIIADHGKLEAKCVLCML